MNRITFAFEPIFPAPHIDDFVLTKYDGVCYVENVLPEVLRRAASYGKNLSVLGKDGKYYHVDATRIDEILDLLKKESYDKLKENKEINKVETITIGDTLDSGELKSLTTTANHTHVAGEIYWSKQDTYTVENQKEGYYIVVKKGNIVNQNVKIKVNNFDEIELDTTGKLVFLGSSADKATNAIVTVYVEVQGAEPKKYHYILNTKQVTFIDKPRTIAELDDGQKEFMHRLEQKEKLEKLTYHHHEHSEHNETSAVAEGSPVSKPARNDRNTETVSTSPAAAAPKNSRESSAESSDHAERSEGGSETHQ